MFELSDETESESSDEEPPRPQGQRRVFRPEAVFRRLISSLPRRPQPVSFE